MGKSRILITGSNGLLGSDLCMYLSDSPKYDVIATTRNTMDITDFDHVCKVLGSKMPDVVIHTAAETNVDRCELEPDHAFLVNTIGTRFLTIACEQLKIPIVFISSCGIFDGRKEEPYTEYDLPAPLTVYARSKHEAEKVVRSLWGRHFIVRIGWLFGGNIDHNKNFIAKRWLEAQSKKDILSADDKFGSPAYSLDIAATIMEIVESGIFGTYHVANRGKCSRYDYVSKIFKLLGKDVNVIPVDSGHFPRAAPVPVSEALENYNLRLMGRDNLRTWEDALGDYISHRFLNEIEK